MDKILEDFIQSRDIETPHNCTAGYIVSNMGADIEEERRFQNELHEIVDKMKEDLVNETKILEGTDIPVYQNELSSSESKEEQWKTDLPSGYSTIDLTPISNEDSNISFSSVSSLNRVRIMDGCDEKYPEQPEILCGANSVDFGNVTGHLNESFDCMEQTINVPVLGIPNEEK